MKSKQSLTEKILYGVHKASIPFTNLFYLLGKGTQPKSSLTPGLESVNKISIWVGAAVIAVNLVILQGLISLSRLDTAQFISLICFSVSIPLLAGVVAIRNLEIVFKRYFSPVFHLLSYLLATGMLLTAVGIGSILWRLSWIASILFCGTSLFMFLFSMAYIYDDGKIDGNGQ